MRVSTCVRCKHVDREVKGPATCKADAQQRRIDDMVKLRLADLPPSCPLLKLPLPGPELTDAEVQQEQRRTKAGGCCGSPAKE